MNHDDKVAPTPDGLKVLVVAKSPINRIVMAKIAERSGLKPVMESPDSASAALRRIVPGTIVLDGGVDNRDCDGLLPAIAALRLATAGPVPAVILLSTRIGTPQSLGLPDTIDAVVAKPITPEKLQPVIERLSALSRG